MNLALNDWTENKYNEFIKFYISNADLDYKNFHSKLVPGYPPEKIIGIRLPVIRKIAKDISKGNILSFMQICRADYYEEVMLKGVLIGLLKPDSFEQFTDLVDNFTALVNNWAICDCFCTSLKYIKKCKKDFYNHIKNYLNSDNPWVIRVGIVIMLSHYIDGEYIDDVLKRIDAIKNDHYYVKMAQAWLVATAYAKFPSETHAYLENNTLDDWTHNKAIQKARESYRVDNEAKLILNNMKRKKG